MARIKQRRLFWDNPADTDLTTIAIYVGDPAEADFLESIDAGNTPPHATVNASAREYFLRTLDEGTYQFAVAAIDDEGNVSDPYQHPDWRNVPLDVTPPGAPSGGGIE